MCFSCKINRLLKMTGKEWIFVFNFELYEKIIRFNADILFEIIGWLGADKLIYDSCNFNNNEQISILDHYTNCVIYIYIWTINMKYKFFPLVLLESFQMFVSIIRSKG